MKLKKILWIAGAHMLLDYEGKCRRLHGHNWKIEITISGPIQDETGMLVDFTLLKNIVDELDHKTLLPTLHNRVIVNDNVIEIRGTEYRFPRRDCMLIPFEHITAESISRYIATKLRLSFTFLEEVTVRVWETPSSMVERKWVKT